MKYKLRYYNIVSKCDDDDKRRESWRYDASGPNGNETPRGDGRQAELPANAVIATDAIMATNDGSESAKYNEMPNHIIIVCLM